MDRSVFLGRLVCSKAGHDGGGVYLVIREEEDYVWLADGKGRSLNKPKRKNKKHLVLLRAFANGETGERIRKGEPPKEEEIRKLIRNYQKVFSNAEEEKNVESRCD